MYVKKNAPFTLIKSSSLIQDISGLGYPNVKHGNTALDSTTNVMLVGCLLIWGSEKIIKVHGTDPQT